MPRATSNYIPKYRQHRASGQARVEIDGKTYYLGPYKSKASIAEYDRLITEWLAGGRRLPQDDAEGTTMAEVMAAYRKHARAYYVKNGKPTAEVVHLDSVLRIIKQLYLRLPSAEFGPRQLKAVRQKMIDAGWTRKTINDHVGRIKRMMRWAAEEELVAPHVHQGLAAVAGLKKGRTEAPDRPPVLPVPEAVMEETISYLPIVVADLIRFMRWTGCRPTEACIIRPCDIDRSGKVWIYKPDSHKTEHHGRERIVYIGPSGQEVLRPYLLRPEDSYCFCPKESESKRRRLQHEARKTPLSYGNKPGSNRKVAPKRTAGSCYNKDSLNRAVTRGVEKANKTRAERELPLLPHWTPNQLRHSAATDIRSKYGLEAAQIILGHSSADVTQVYAERDVKRALEVVQEAG